MLTRTSLYLLHWHLPNYKYFYSNQLLGNHDFVYDHGVNEAEVIEPVEEEGERLDEGGPCEGRAQSRR